MEINQDNRQLSQIRELNSNTSNDIDQYKKLLKHIFSTSSCYQYFEIIFSSLSWILISFNNMISSFVFMNPIFNCQGHLLSQKDACSNMGQCQITNDFTAVFQDSLYCQRQLVRSTIQSIFAFGIVIGISASGISANFFGRKKTLILIFNVGICSYICMVIGIKLNIQWLMILSSLLNGIYGSALMILTILMTCEICSQKMKQMSLPFYCSVYGFAEILIGLVYLYMPSWEKYLIFMLMIPSFVLLLVAILFQIQTPLHVLIIEKNLSKFTLLLGKIVNKNDRNYEKSRIVAAEIISLYQQQGRLTLRAQIFNFCQIKNNLKPIFFLIGILTSFNIYYYGIQGSMERIGLNFGVNMIVMGMIQCFSYLVGSYLSTFMDRKIGLNISIVCSVCIGLLFSLKGIKQNLFLETILLGLGRIGSVFIYTFFMQLQTETIEIKYRSHVVVIVNGCGQLVRICIPFMINYFNEQHAQTVVIISILLGVMGLPIGLLIQQRNRYQHQIGEAKK